MNFFNIINNGYLEMTKNQVLNFQKKYMLNNKLFIYCMDNLSFNELNEFCTKINTKNIELNLSTNIVDVPNQEHIFGTPNWKKITSARIGEIQKVVQKLDGAFHSEADVFWFKDPASLVLEVGEFDWLMQHDNPHIDNCYLNIGCAYYKNTENSNRLFNDWIKYFREHDEIDQYALYLMLNGLADKQELTIENTHAPYELIAKKINVNIKTFSRKKVPNGYNAFTENYLEKYDVYGFHANHCSGNNIKIERLKSANAWLL